MKEILKSIKEYKRIIIHSHTRPDGDAIGSQYGLYYLIKDSFPDKEVYVTGESSNYLDFLGVPKLIDENLFCSSLSICVDTANSERLSDDRYKLSDYSIKIDHHIKDEEYCDYEYIDESAASVTQIITEFYINFKNELVMSSDCATALYIGLITDSGNFSYDKVNKKTFLCASELIEYIDLNFIKQSLSKESIQLLRLKGYCLSNFCIHNHFAYIKLDKNIMNEFNVSEEEAASLVNIISGLDSVLVWAMFLETADEIRVRLRSKGPIINILANKYNGGGHALASGAKLKSFDEIYKFVRDVDELICEFKN